MALTRTLAQIVDAIQRTADVVAFTDKHPVSYIKDLACRGIGALDTIIKTTDTEFRPLGSITYTTNGIASTFALPVDCRSIIAIEYTVDGQKDYLDPFEWVERPLLVDADLSGSTTGRARGYKRIGSNLEVLPKPNANHSILMWYSTTASQPTADSDTVDTYDRLDSYIIWWAAREIAAERENWARVKYLDERLATAEGDIRVLARSRDVSAPSRIVDRKNIRDAFGRRRFWR